MATNRTNKGAGKNRTQSSVSDSFRPIPSCESDVPLAERIRDAMNGEPTASFGRRCGVKEATLRNILLGAMPRADNLFAIADAAGVTVEWLATGKWPVYRSDLHRALDVAKNIEPRPSAELDIPRLREAVILTERSAAVQPLTPEQRADMILSFYQHLSKPSPQ